MRLIVTVPFDTYATGDVIADADAIARALDANPNNVTKVADPPPEDVSAAPAPAKKAKDAPAT